MDIGGEIKSVARKPHECQVCGLSIAVGTGYARFKGRYEGEWQNWAAHEPCMRMYMHCISPDPTPNGDMHWADFFGEARSAGVLAQAATYYPLPESDECQDEWERTRLAEITRQIEDAKAADRQAAEVVVG
jgi:hypothetical protein